MDNVKKAGKVYKNSDFIDAERDNLSLLSRMIISNSTITISEKKVLIVIPDEMHDIFETEKITREIKAAAASYYGGLEVLAV